MIPEKYKNVTFLMTDLGIGDAIVMSFLIYTLRQSGFIVTIVAEPRISYLFGDFIEVDKVITLENYKKLKKFKQQIKGFQTDLLIDLFDINGNSYKRAKLIHYLHPIHTIEFNQISKLFDTSIEHKEYQLHFSTRMLKVLDHLNIEYKDVRYRFSASPAAYTEVQHFISKNNLQDKLIIMFNPFGSFKIKSFSYEQIQQLTDVLSKYDDCAMIITGEGDKLSKICCTHSNVFIGQFSSFFAAIALIDTCDLLISVDTSVVHIANGYNRKLISIYNNMMLGNFDSNYVWSPNYSNAVQVFTKENKKISDGDDIANMDLTELLSQIDIAINQIRNERLSRNQI